MDARTPPLFLTPPRAAPPNTDTPVGRPRRRATLNLGLPGGAEALPEGSRIVSVCLSLEGGGLGGRVAFAKID